MTEKRGEPFEIEVVGPSDTPKAIIAEPGRYLCIPLLEGETLSVVRDYKWFGKTPHDKWLVAELKIPALTERGPERRDGKDRRTWGTSGSKRGFLSQQRRKGERRSR